MKMSDLVTIKVIGQRDIQDKIKFYSSLSLNAIYLSCCNPINFCFPFIKNLNGWKLNSIFGVQLQSWDWISLTNNALFMEMICIMYRLYNIMIATECPREGS